MAIRRIVVDGTRARIEIGKPKRKRINRRSDVDRLTHEPWRANGYDHAYRKARQAVIERQQGRCAVTGTQVATKDAKGVWHITEPGAGVHHKRALSEGGGSGADNLVLLSASAHALIDARRRRESNQ